MIFKRGIFNPIKVQLKQLKEALDEHRLSINDNSAEISSNYSYLCEINSKIDKLASRLDQVEMQLNSQPRRLEIKPLNYAEKQVFLVLYTEEAGLTYADIALKTGTSPQLVREYLDKLIEKGVPITKSYYNSTAFVKLNQAFKELQAKENLINLSLKSFVET